MVRIKIGKNNNIVVKVNLKKFLVSCLIFLMVTGWVFSGWPQIFDFEVGEQEIVFPPKIQQARAAQFGRPDSTVSSTDWAFFGAATHHDAVNEEEPNGDTNYASTSQDEAIIKFGLSDVSNPGTTSGHIIRVTARALNGAGGTEKIHFYLYQGALLIGTSAKTIVSRGAYATYTYAVLPEEAETIGDYADLQIWIHIETTDLDEPIRITQVELEVPDAPSANEAPVVDAVTLTPDPITLTDNTTTTVTCTTTISDLQGGGTIVSATATIYRSGVTGTSTCEANDNNCYRNITPFATSTFENYFYATFTVDLWFHADPTDDGDYSGEDWECYVIAEDEGPLTGTGTGSAELNSLSALVITASIDYGTLVAGASTTVSVTTTATTTGNMAIDVKIRGTDLATSSFTIPGEQQKYATTIVAWSDGAATAMATTSETYLDLELESVKPTQHDPVQSAATDIIYWGILIPVGQDFGTYYGTTTVVAAPD